MLTKIAFPLIAFLFGGLITALTLKKIEKPLIIPPIPDCICNPAAVSVQPFDVDKIKNLKTFQYAPQFSGNISVAGVDSLRLKIIIQQSVDASLKQYLKPRFLK